MSSRPPPRTASPSKQGGPSSSSVPARQGPGNPISFATILPPEEAAAEGSSTGKKKKRRGGKKHRRNRRQSFAAASDVTDNTDREAPRPSLLDLPKISERSSTFYTLGQQGVRSNSSSDSEALLDHREHTGPRVRRKSIQRGSRPNVRAGQQQHFPSMPDPQYRSGLSRAQAASDDEDANENTPIISPMQRRQIGYTGDSPRGLRNTSRPRRKSNASSRSSNRGLKLSLSSPDYDVNNPPSVPNSPKGLEYDDVMLTGELTRTRTNESSLSPRATSRDAIIDIDDDSESGEYRGSAPKDGFELRRRPTTSGAENDVCFPAEGMYEHGEEEYHDHDRTPRQRHRRKPWPDYSVLEEWAQAEKEERTMEGIRSKKMSEPMMVNGRLRPKAQVWHREAAEAPYRWTYFNEEFENTIHSQTLSELVSQGQTFEELFSPEPPVLEDSSDDEAESSPHRLGDQSAPSLDMSRAGTRQSSILGERSAEKQASSGEQTGQGTPRTEGHPHEGHPHEKQKRYGPRPVFWLDVLRPTEEEMKCLARAFGIHSLTVEDIVAQEAREKIEMFRNYYFINFRSFEQDSDSEDYLEPVNIYVIVFNEGVISFHFSMTPHPANVRRRIRQLQEFMIIDSQWIAYGLIDDITDAYVPLITSIEEEVDVIDDAILDMHSPREKNSGNNSSSNRRKSGQIRDFFRDCFGRNSYERIPDQDNQEDARQEKKSEAGGIAPIENGGNLLRRVGETRKKVMELYRLLVNKGDVIKTLAKRCNERWQVAPRSEIGLYLGDIQDHIVTMTGNLSHYENLLSRSHSNYLAQINLRMNERGEATADVLGKLTVLGTIVLPMNIITGMWGMNVHVPGQEKDSLWWFWGITAGLILFAFSSFLYCKKVYKIV